MVTEDRMKMTTTTIAMHVKRDWGIERLHVTPQMLCNHFHVAKEVGQHMHSTRSVVGVDATKHVQLQISSEPTGSTMDQSCYAYNCTARVVKETREGRNTVLSRS